MEIHPAGDELPAGVEDWLSQVCFSSSLQFLWIRMLQKKELQELHPLAGINQAFT